MENWTSVFTTDKLYKAELVRTSLLENGIEAVILNKEDSSFTTFGEIDVMIPKEDADRATEIIKSVKL
ncbi:MAG: DUF2007 domain-containing protein [Culturomica sp.]|jgi:hypothetical protein|nr:DUF2007 domain-containing protein [Culturomica sp.]